MIQYAKIIDEQTKEVQIGVGVDDQYYKDIGMQRMDVEQAWTGNWYVAGYAPQKPIPTRDEIIKQQIQELEQSITDRNIRGAILGDNFALNKINEIEAQIEELRKQLED